MKVSGVPISSFSAVTKLEDEDLFLVTVPTDQNCKFYDNRKTSYENFSNQVLDQMSSKYQLGTMAWEVSSDYAKKRVIELLNDLNLDLVEIQPYFTQAFNVCYEKGKYLIIALTDMNDDMKYIKDVKSLVLILID